MDDVIGKFVVGSFAVLIIAVLLCVAVIGVINIVKNMPEVTLTDHALETHGSDAVRVYQAYCTQGPDQKWLEPNGTIHFLCELPDKRIGDLICIEDGCTTFNKTSFIPRNGKLSEIINWLKSKQAVLKWQK